MMKATSVEGAAINQKRVAEQIQFRGGRADQELPF
jgi:hypothetical protein